MKVSGVVEPLCAQFQLALARKRRPLLVRRGKATDTVVHTENLYGEVRALSPPLLRPEEKGRQLKVYWKPILLTVLSP